MKHLRPSTPASRAPANGAWFDRPENGHLEELKMPIAYDEVLDVPFGQWVLPTAYRKSVTGVLPFPAPLFWNASIG